jgi:hypothetical protein
MASALKTGIYSSFHRPDFHLSLLVWVTSNASGMQSKAAAEDQTDQKKRQLNTAGCRARSGFALKSDTMSLCLQRVSDARPGWRNWQTQRT